MPQWIKKTHEEEVPRGLKPARMTKIKELGGAPFGRLRAGSEGAPLLKRTFSAAFGARPFKTV
jgi:hypothetical protein